MATARSSSNKLYRLINKKKYCLITKIVKKKDQFYLRNIQMDTYMIVISKLVHVDVVEVFLILKLNLLRLIFIHL